LLGWACSEASSPYYVASTDGRASPASSERAANEEGGAFADTAGGGDDLTAPSGIPFAFCERAGAMTIDRLGILLAIARHYDEARIEDCRTAGLLPDLDEQSSKVWWDYLLNYSNALAGCPLITMPLPGGIAAFGPANTAAIGLSHPPFTQEAAGLLIEQFLRAFVAGFGLAESEEGMDEEYLWRAAAATVEEDASDWMSQCSADAGVSDGGEL
jgi:hypothetical protein